MPGPSADPPANNKFKECEPIALKDTIWKISDGLKKFTREEAEGIITSHGGTIQTDPKTPVTHELKYAKDTYSFIGGGKATIFEPGFLSYVRGQVMFQRIKPREVNNHYSLHELAFVFAGTMPWLRKEEYKELIQDFGGRLQKKVNVNTNYVVVGYKDVPEAVMKVVKEMEIKTLDEDGFIELLRTRRPPGLKDSRVDMEEVEALTNDQDVEMQSEEKVADKDAEVPSEEMVVDKEDVGKTKKTATEKKSKAVAKKKDVEKQPNPPKKTTSVKKPRGGKVSGKVLEEQGSWAGRLRSRGGEGGESSTA